VGGHVKKNHFLVLSAAIIFLAAGSGISGAENSAGRDMIIALPPPPLAIFDLPAISFATADKEPRFVKIAFSLGYYRNPEAPETLPEELAKKKSQMIAIINDSLKSTSYGDLREVEKLIGLSEGIRERINAILAGGRIMEVYLKEITVN
jgi:flagellar basal body-associated protein FliL